MPRFYGKVDVFEHGPVRSRVTEDNAPEFNVLFKGLQFSGAGHFFFDGFVQDGEHALGGRVRHLHLIPDVAALTEALGGDAQRNEKAEKGARSHVGVGDPVDAHKQRRRAGEHAQHFHNGAGRRIRPGDMQKALKQFPVYRLESRAFMLVAIVNLYDAQRVDDVLEFTEHGRPTDQGFIHAFLDSLA